MTLTLQGTGVSNGVAIGPIHIIRRDSLEILEYVLPDEAIDDEVQRFERAVDYVKHQLRNLRDNIPIATESDITAFIDTHLLMLDDSTLSRVPIKIIRETYCNAEWALKLQRDALVKVFDEMDDPYLRTRRDDIDHVVTSIQRVLLNSPIYHHVDHIQEQRLSGHIIVADDLSPADTVLMQHQGIAAFITEGGGPTSHTAILARSLNIPAIVGVHHAQQILIDHETVIIDAQHGIVLANPITVFIRHYQNKRRQAAHLIETHKLTRDIPSITQDGIRIILDANIELPEDIEPMINMGAEGVGLYRTEFLFMNRDTPPSEEEQFETYRDIVKTLNGKALTIRTLDLGADKQVNGNYDGGAAIINPALGLRAIRLCLQEPSLFVPQLLAILRASAYGKVRIMLPMISTPNEIIQTRRLIDALCHELTSEQIPFDSRIELGGMIETPAAALNAQMLCEYLDFMSIGTNDLIQYTLAIDRIDDEVNYLYNPLHPAVLRLIAMTIMAGADANIPVTMCGEMAGDTDYTRLLLGMGLRKFSMHPNALPDVKQVILESNVATLTPFVKQVLHCQSHTDFQMLVDQLQHLH